jgi:hypothetical protein
MNSRSFWSRRGDRLAEAQGVKESFLKGAQSLAKRLYGELQVGLFALEDFILLLKLRIINRQNRELTLERLLLRAANCKARLQIRYLNSKIRLVQGALSVVIPAVAWWHGVPRAEVIRILDGLEDAENARNPGTGKP